MTLKTKIGLLIIISIIGLFLFVDVSHKQTDEFMGVTKLQTLEERLVGKNAKERATIKGEEIAKTKNTPRERVQFSNADYDIEIVDTNAIEGGVEVFAKAWTSNGEQVGFGADGSVEIERFRIFNPPLLAEDAQGGISKQFKDEFSKEIKTIRYTEDPLKALKQSIAHTISVKKERFGSENIQDGKVGNTTSTFYSDPDVESTSVDGSARYATGASGSWATARAAVTGTSADTTGSLVFGTSEAAGSTNNFTIIRMFTLFDSSAIPDGDTITSATVSLYIVSKNDGDDDGSDYVWISTSTPASNTDITTADYDQVGLTSLATSVDITGITLSVYQDFALNATGVLQVSKTGVSKFGWKEGHDVDNNQIANNAQVNVSPVSADTGAGTATDPKLVVEHSGGTVALPMLILFE